MKVMAVLRIASELEDKTGITRTKNVAVAMDDTNGDDNS